MGMVIFSERESWKEAGAVEFSDVLSTHADAAEPGNERSWSGADPQGELGDGDWTTSVEVSNLFASNDIRTQFSKLFKTSHSPHIY